MAHTFNNSDSSHHRLVIIGAGISGVAAGNVLCNEGMDDFVILEATDRIGGRIYSIDLETEMDHKVELGANWIHGIDLNPIYTLAVKNNLLSSQYHGRHLGKKMIFLMENGDPVNLRIIHDVDLQYGMLMSECEDFFKQQIPTPLENDSVGSYVEREFAERIARYTGDEHRLRRMIFSQRLLGECVISGANNMRDVALSEVGCFEELPGVHYVIPPGFEAVIDILRSNIPQDNILLNHPVTKVTWNQKGNDGNDAAVCIECSNGKKFFADLCLVTVSLGFLKHNAARLFSPQLPEFKMDAVRGIAMGTVNKVILEFDGQILPDEVFRLEVVWNRDNVENEDISESWIKKIGSYEAVSDNVLIGWISGREAEYMETLTDEEVGRKCVESLKVFLSKTMKAFPNLKKVTRSAWKSHPFTLGSYCYIPVGASADYIRMLGEPVLDAAGKPVLLFAGEATHSTFYSSSHGALLSGRREGERILSLLSSH